MEFFSQLPAWGWIVIIICWIYLTFAPAHWIPNLIADVAGVIVPSVFMGIQLKVEGMPFFAFIIAIIFAILSNIVIVGQGSSSQWESKTENGITYTVFTGLSLSCCFISWISIVFLVNFICTNYIK